MTTTAMPQQEAINRHLRNTTAALVAIAVIVVSVACIFAALFILYLHKAKRRHKKTDAAVAKLPGPGALETRNTTPVAFTATQPHPLASSVRRQSSSDHSRWTYETSWSGLISRARAQHNPFDSHSAIKDAATTTCEHAISPARHGSKYSRGWCEHRKSLSAAPRFGQVNCDFGRLVGARTVQDEGDIEMSGLDDNGSIISLYALPVETMSKDGVQSPKAKLVQGSHHGWGYVEG